MALQSDLTREGLSGNSACGTYLNLSCRDGNGWDTADAIFRKSPYGDDLYDVFKNSLPTYHPVRWPSTFGFVPLKYALPKMSVYEKLSSAIVCTWSLPVSTTKTR